jgi:ferric-dicitrate binding protein FerR (iron transport regulator)
VVNADVQEEAAWKDNLFMFTDVKFEELCRRLERWYDVNITLADSELKEIKYTGNFRNEETIWQVLDIIKITTPIRYELKNRSLIIYKE